MGGTPWNRWRHHADDHVRPATNSTEKISQGFDTPTTVGDVGDWVVDGTSPLAGSASAHPPSLPANSHANMSFACGNKVHSQISFAYRGLAPAAGQVLKLYVDEVLYQTFGQTPGNNFAGVTMTVPTGIHTYRWEAEGSGTDGRGATAVLGRLDSGAPIRRVSPTPPARSGFEEGFVPPEFASNSSGSPPRPR